jgi:hypothetical protein
LPVPKETEMKFFERFAVEEYIVIIGFICLTHTAWIWPSLYFQLFSIPEVILTLLVILIGLSTGLLVIQVTLGHKIARRLLQLAFVSGLLLWGAKLALTIDGAPRLSDGQKIALYLSLMPFSCVVLWLRTDIWLRFCRSAGVLGVIFMLFPWGYAATIAQPVYWPSLSGKSVTEKPTVTLPKQNTIVLLIDELSYGSESSIVEAIQKTGLRIAVKSFEPVGKRTINVIPAYFNRTTFDESSPCGPHQLCSGNQVFDFSKVQATSNDIDVVGFYHRYCEIKGLRSCANNPWPSNSAPFKDILCRLFLQFVKSSGCDVGPSLIAKAKKLRDTIWQNSFSAPFWNAGGILYIHAYAPHPLPQVNLGMDLAREYRRNLSDTALIVGQLAQKGLATFGQDFKLIVFTDHPLRSDFWCNVEKSRYSGVLCDPNNFAKHSQVPVIVASASQPDPIRIDSIMNIFDLLFVDQ